MRGTLGSLSPHVASRSSITASAYLAPILSLMYFLAWGIVRSGHQHLYDHFKHDYFVTSNASKFQCATMLLCKTTTKFKQES